MKPSPPVLLLASSVTADGSDPKGNGWQTVAEHAHRASLEPPLAPDLGAGVRWDGVLILAGTFVTGIHCGEDSFSVRAVRLKLR
jgi:hypothetical protein